MAFGGEVDNVLVFDPPQVQPRPIPVASIYARLGGLEAAAGVVSSAGAVTLSRLCVLWGGMSFVETLKFKSVNGNAGAVCGLSCFLQSPHWSTCWSESFHPCIQTSDSPRLMPLRSGIYCLGVTPVLIKHCRSETWFSQARRGKVFMPLFFSMTLEKIGLFKLQLKL